MSRRPKAVQLQLDFAAPRLINTDEFLRTLARRGCRRVEEVRFKKNRGRIISLAKDGRTLHVHACFQEANEDVIRAVVTFLNAGPRSYAYREAVRAMQDFFDTHAGKYVPLTGEAEDHRVTTIVQRLPCVGTAAQRAFLREAYARFNSSHFGGRLPNNVRMRLSDRMKSRLGHVRYHTTSSGDRLVLELALNIHLLLPRNEAALFDTLLHEMTHIEAWLDHSERAHGRRWKEIARRVGCEATACSTQPIHRRRKRVAITEVPDRAFLPQLPLVSEGSAA
ncbi:MAG TPA: SprT-like domain-containing protein [Longimicrobiales bacterium]|nr:SprT-like domain-containing protein [Longimicrobiales bacterium]